MLTKQHLLRNAVFLTLSVAALAFSSCKKDETTGSKSDAKQLISFTISALTPPVSASINESAKTITAEVPAGTDLSSLSPVITVSDKARVSPASGAAQDFTLPVTYVVTAEDGSTAAYTASITVNSSDPLTLSGTMTGNTTLTDRSTGIDYIIDGAFFVEGNALLTVEPGVKILFTSVYSGIFVNENAGLRMVGTAEKPIVFSGPVNNQNNGSWHKIQISSPRADNRFEYCEFYNGGSDDEGEVVWVTSGARLAFNHCKISGSLGYGISASGTITEFSSNTIENCAKAPVWEDYMMSIPLIDSTSVLTNNNLKYIRVDNSNPFETDATIHMAGVPYFMNYGFEISNYTTTIEPGVSMLFAPSTLLQVNQNGKIIADGTAARPITFTALSKEPGGWKGIEISSKFSNSFSHCTIEYAGSDYANLMLNYDCRIRITDSKISNSLNYGAYYYDETTIEHSNVTFENCAEGNVHNYSDDTTHTDFP